MDAGEVCGHGAGASPLIGGSTHFVEIFQVDGAMAIVPRSVVVVVAVVVERPVDIQHRCHLFHLEVQVLIFGNVECRVDALSALVAAATAEGGGGDMACRGGEVRLAFGDGSRVGRDTLDLQLLVA